MKAKNFGGSSVIRHGTGSTPIGDVLVAVSERGVCAVRLLDGKKPDRPLADLRRNYPHAELVADQRAATHVLSELNAMLEGKQPVAKVELDLRGTPFQQRVWKLMCQIPRGQTCSYRELAQRAGRPRAVRAVANACARNPIGILVPCHRVLRSDGSLGGYGWGLARKRRLLDCEQQ